MRKVLLSFLAVIVLATSAYAAFALSRNNSNSPIVKLFGPGATESVCIARMRPHFDKMEDALTDIAEAFLANDQLQGLSYRYDYQSNELSVLLEGTSGATKPNQKETEFFISKLNQLGRPHYFSPQNFGKENGMFYAGTRVECGISAFDWVRLRLGINYERQNKAVVVNSNYFYSPTGIDEINKCVEPLPIPDPITDCEVALTDKWGWAARWGVIIEPRA